MNDPSVRSDIALLEDRIEELNQSIARCDKVALAAKLAIGGGALWFVLSLIGLVGLSITAFFACVAAVLGGFVLLGSNKTTREEYEAARDAAEDKRRALIDTISLRLVDDPVVTLH